MKKEQFIKAIELVKSFDEKIDTLYDLKIDLTNSFLFEEFGKLADLLWVSNFTEEGVDWINWWLFEKPGFGGDPNQAYDENENVIPTDTIDDLWNIVKDYQK